MKKAFITGVTGQDGSYLAEYLLEKNYEVHAIIRRSSVFTTQRIDHLLSHTNLNTYHGDLTDSSNLHTLLSRIQPDEIYNLGAQSHVAVSFEVPEYTANVDAIGTLRILDAIMTLGFSKKIKFYQAGTSEMFGASKPPQNENTNFYPRSPYGVAKLYAHWITINYRESYNLFACNGILFNHESPIRGETFVTKKIVTALCQIAKTGLGHLYLGNLYAKRDWGHAKDYVVAIWKMLQQKKPKDYVISSGKQYSVKYFVYLVSKELGMKITWKGKGINEKGYLNNKAIISVDKKYFRPAEVNSLLGDSSKARKELKWKPYYDIYSLTKEMVTEELKKIDDK